MEQTLQNFSTQIDSMLTNVASVLSSTVKGIITAGFAFIIAVYISLDGKRVGRHKTYCIIEGTYEERKNKFARNL